MARQRMTYDDILRIAYLSSRFAWMRPLRRARYIAGLLGLGVEQVYIMMRRHRIGGPAVSADNSHRLPPQSQLAEWWRITTTKRG